MLDGAANRGDRSASEGGRYMYLFSRSGRLAPGNAAAAQAWAMNVTEKVNQVTELNVSLWTRVFSPKFGTLAWTATVQDLAELEDSDAKLMVDNGFLSLVDEGARYLTDEGLDDTVISILTPLPEGAPATSPDYPNTVSAVIAPGQ